MTESSLPLFEFRGRRGAALLESLVALTVLGMIAVPALGMVADHLHGIGRAHTTERMFLRASRFMSAVALWPAADLDRHLGRTAQGPWYLLIDRTSPDFYQVALIDRAVGTVVLRTSVMRRAGTERE